MTHLTSIAQMKRVVRPTPVSMRLAVRPPYTPIRWLVVRLHGIHVVLTATCCPEVIIGTLVQ